MIRKSILSTLTLLALSGCTQQVVDTIIPLDEAFIKQCDLITITPLVKKGWHQETYAAQLGPYHTSAVKSSGRDTETVSTNEKGEVISIMDNVVSGVKDILIDAVIPFAKSSSQTDYSRSKSKQSYSFSLKENKHSIGHVSCTIKNAEMIATSENEGENKTNTEKLYSKLSCQIKHQKEGFYHLTSEKEGSTPRVELKHVKSHFDIKAKRKRTHVLSDGSRTTDDFNIWGWTFSKGGKKVALFLTQEPRKVWIKRSVSKKEKEILLMAIYSMILTPQIEK